MKRKKQFALNKLFNVFIISGLFLAWVGVEAFKEDGIAWGIFFGILAVLFIGFSVVFQPCCYAFDQEGVSICYIFLPVERYLWENIYAITVIEETSSTRGEILDLFFNTVFSISGTNEGTCRFYMKGHIRKSFRTKHLLEKYWDGTITGYLFEDVQKTIHKRRAKKQKRSKTYLTDEVVAMEREIRSEAREWLKPLVAKAKQQNLDIRTKYLYITKDFEELNSRPKEGYTYTLVAEISRFDETDENRIVVVSVDLLYVRLGKTAYRGVKNKHIKEELEFTFSDLLNEINKNGIEIYCKNSETKDL